jgi:hypothetical protein
MNISYYKRKKGALSHSFEAGRVFYLHELAENGVLLGKLESKKSPPTPLEEGVAGLARAVTVVTGYPGEWAAVTVSGQPR